MTTLSTITSRLFAPLIYFASLFTGKVARELPGMELRELPPQAQLAPHQVGRPKWRDWSEKKAIRQAYEESETAFCCLQKNSTAAASVRWFIEREVGPDRWEPDTDHELNRLLKKPNPEHSWRHLVKLMSMYSQGDGNILLDITRLNDGTPWELWPLRPEITRPIPAGPGSEQLISEYEVKPEGRSAIRIPSSDVVHLQEIPDPNNPYWGMSRLRAGGKSIEIEIAARDFQKHSLDNYGTMSMLVTPASDPEPGSAPLSKKDAKRERKDFERLYKGAKNARKIGWSSGRVETHDMSKTPKELDFTKGRDYVRENICSLFDTPPPIIGVFGRAIYNNIKTAREIWWEDGLVPWLTFLRDGLNHGFVDREYPGDRVRLNFDLSRVPALAHRFDAAIDRAIKLKTGLEWEDHEIEARVDLGRPSASNSDPSSKRNRHKRSAA